MRRVEKEIYKAYEYDMGRACKLAYIAGYDIVCYDGDGETGMLPPVIYFNRP